MAIRVCFAIKDLSDGGAQVQLTRLALELASDSAYEVALVYFEPGRHFAELSKSNVKMLELNPRWSRLPVSVFRLRRFLRSNKTEILNTWLAIPDVVGRLATIGTSTKWVIAERDSNYDYRRVFRLRAALGKAADLVIANSRMGADYWKSIAPELSSVVIPNIVNAVAADGLESKIYDVVAVGRFAKQKNPQLTARVLADFAVRHPEVQVGMIGRGQYFDEVKELYLQNSWPANFELPGYLTGASQAIVKAKVLVLLSSHEGQPNVVMEAVIGGTVPVVSRIPEHIELLGAEYPFLVDLTDEVSDIANTIERAMNADSEVLKYAQAKLAKQTPAVIAVAYKQEFEKLVR